jgi:transcription elongation factor/antiterminator RfaH
MLLETENCTHPFPADSLPSWYAVQTRSRHERIACQHLMMRGFSLYLPTIVETHVWSDRRKKVEVPLFPGYVFVRLIAHNEWRVQVLRTPGVVRFVGGAPEGSPIPEEQIASVRAVVERKMAYVSHPFLKVGQRVRVCGGALEGVEGIFVKHNGSDTLVISVDAIQRSLSVSIQGYDLEVL